MSERRKIWPVILSGGTGSRLWPLSRSLYPKQLLALASDRSMIQETAARVADNTHFHLPTVVGNEEHRFIIAEQLRQSDARFRTLILEPEGRNTAPAVALAALSIAEEEPDALVLVMPSDHVIGKPADFAEAVSRGARAAEDGFLVTFGIKPAGPETGYGYIECGNEIGHGNGVCEVARFTEKPDKTTAQKFLNEGNFFWNSGIFMMRADSFLEQLNDHAPDIAAACRDAMAKARSDMDFLRPDAATFRRSPADSIDYAVMEKTDRAAVVPADIGWSDVGSWRALWEIGDKDESGNVRRGDVIVEDVHNSLLYSDGPTIAAIGVEDLVVVTTKDAVLVTDQERAQDVKKLVERLKQDKRDQHRTHTVVHRPWGSYETTDLGERFQTKRIVVKPGQQLSLQKHHHRAEHWVIVRGTARVTRGNETFMLSENESVYIPLGTKHRLENPGKIPLHLVEIQTGSYLGEDDIVRFEDTYGRAEPEN